MQPTTRPARRAFWLVASALLAISGTCLGLRHADSEGDRGSVWELIEPERLSASSGATVPVALGQVRDYLTISDSLVVIDGLPIATEADHLLLLRAVDGAFVDSVGRHGQGPLELEGPVSLSRSPFATGELWVNDTMGRKLAAYTIDDAKIEGVAEYKVDGPPIGTFAWCAATIISGLHRSS